MAVYKILRADEWAALQDAGSLRGSPVDLRDGFVHLSAADQAEETAARHFAGEEGLRLLALDELRLSDLLWSVPLPLEGGRHRFPPP